MTQKDPLNDLVELARQNGASEALLESLRALRPLNPIDDPSWPLEYPEEPLKNLVSDAQPPAPSMDYIRSMFGKTPDFSSEKAGFEGPSWGKEKDWFVDKIASDKARGPKKSY